VTSELSSIGTSLVENPLTQALPLPDIMLAAPGGIRHHAPRFGIRMLTRLVSQAIERHPDARFDVATRRMLRFPSASQARSAT
jgi:hypothetical protein